MNIFMSFLLVILLITNPNQIPYFLLAGIGGAFCLHALANRNLKLTGFPVKIFLIYICGVLATLINWENNYSYHDLYLAKWLKYSIDMFVAMFVYMYLRSTNIKVIYSSLLWTCLISLAGVFYNIYGIFVQGEPMRLRFWFAEPSAAGYFYCVVFFMLPILGEGSKWRTTIATLFKVVGLLVFSKAQYAVLSIFFLLRAHWVVRALSLVFVLMVTNIYGFYLYNNFAIYKELYSLVSALSQDGLAGLNVSQGVWGTYIIRLSGIFLSISSIFENPFGLGFNGFHGYYISSMVSSGLYLNIMSDETAGLFDGLWLVTPKSNLLEFIVTFGLGAAFILFLMCGRIIRFISAVREIKWAFYMMLVVSVTLELNPFFLYLAIFSAIADHMERIGEQNEH